MKYYYLLIALVIIILVLIYKYLNRLINLKVRENTIKSIKEALEYNKEKGKPSNINDWSYQRYCNFFDQVQIQDEAFNKKIECIYDMIVNLKETDLDKIAEDSGCTFEELLLKIAYLKNKMKLDKYLYIDKGERVIRRCSKEDMALLDKYSKFIYDHHYQPREIALKLPGATATNLDTLEDRVIEDIAYLDDKYLINCLNIDKVDRRIIYYSVEKHKKEKDYVSVTCERCGALNDVPRNGKERCRYCRSIVEDVQKN